MILFDDSFRYSFRHLELEALLASLSRVVEYDTKVILTLIEDILML